MQKPNTIEIALLYSILTDQAQDFQMDKINFLNKNTQQFWSYFQDQHLVQVAGLFGCQRGVEREIKKELQQDIILSQYLKESEKGNLISIKFNNTILFCLILAESFFKSKPISEKAIEIVLFRILHDLTDNVTICLNDEIYNDWYSGDVIPFSTKLLQRNDYDFSEESNKKIDVYTCNRYQIQQSISKFQVFNSQTLAPQINIRQKLVYNDSEEKQFLQSYEDFTFSLMLQILTSQNNSIILLIQKFKKEHQSEKLKDQLYQLTQKFENRINEIKKELVNQILNMKRPYFLKFSVWEEQKEQKQTETQIQQIFSTLKNLENENLQPYFPEGFEEKYQKIVRKSLDTIKQERKAIHSQFLNNIKNIIEEQRKYVKFAVGKINFKVNRLNDNPEEKVSNIWPILDEQSRQIIDCNVLQIKAGEFQIIDFFQTKEKATFYIIETIDKTYILFHQYKAQLFKQIRQFDLKDTKSAIYFHDYNRNYLYIFNYKQIYVQQIIITNYGEVQDDKQQLYQSFENQGKNQDFQVSQVAYLNLCNQFIVLTELGQVYRQQQQGEVFQLTQCLLDKDKLSQYSDFTPSSNPKIKYKQLLSCPSGKYFYLANSFCCDRYDQSCLRIQSITIKGQIKIFADFSDVIILDQIDNLSENKTVHVISNLVQQKKFNKQQNDEKKVIGNPGLDIVKGSFSKFGPNAQFLLKGKKKMINLNLVAEELKKIETYFNFMNLSEATISYQKLQYLECENGLIKNIAFSRVPLQLCTIENGILIPLYDGFRQQNQIQTNIDVDQKVKQLHLGFFEDHLLEKENKIFVVGIIGKQSSGKSYLLNRVFGTRFSVSSARCTDGVWASIAYVEDQTFVVLDCEGLFNGARTEKEEIKMLAFLTAVSDITILNSDLTFSRHLNDLFNNLVEASKQLNDDKLFIGILNIVLRDVSSQDNTGLDQELLRNLERLREGGSEEIVFLNKLFNNKLAVEKLFNNENKLFDEQLVQMRNYFLQNSIKSNRWKNGKELIQMMKILLCQLELSNNANASLIDLRIRIEKIFQDGKKEWYEFSSYDFAQDNLMLPQNNYKFQRFEVNEYITFDRTLLTQLQKDLQLQDTISAHNSNLSIQSIQFNKMMELRKESILQKVISETSCIDNIEVKGDINNEYQLLETFIKNQIDQYQFCMEKCSECYLQCKHFKKHIKISEELQKRLENDINQLKEQFRKSKIKNSDQEQQLRKRVSEIQEDINKSKKTQSELQNLQKILEIRNKLQEITNLMTKYDFYEQNERQINLNVFGMPQLINKGQKTINLDIDQIEQLISQINKQAQQLNDEKFKNIEQIQANKSSFEQLKKDQQDINLQLTQKQYLKDSVYKKKENLICKISQLEEQQRKLQDQIKEFNIQLSQNHESKIEELQFTILEARKKNDGILSEIEELLKDINEIQPQIKELQKLSQIQFIEHFKSQRSIRDQLTKQIEENEKNQEELEQQKGKYDKLKKKLEDEKKKKTPQKKIIEKTQQDLFEYDELKIYEQIRKFEKEKEELNALESNYNFENLCLYEDCETEFLEKEDLQGEQKDKEESQVQYQLNGQNQGQILQYQEKELKYEFGEESNNNENQEEDMLQQKVSINRIKFIENGNMEIENQQIIQQEQEQETLKQEFSNQQFLKENKQQEIMDLFFKKKNAELNVIVQEMNIKQQDIKQIEINIRSWSSQIQNIKDYLNLIDTYELLKSDIAHENLSLEELEKQYQNFELKEQNLKQQLELQKSQTVKLQDKDHNLQQLNDEIDKQTLQLNKRSNELKTFQNHLIMFLLEQQNLKQIEKQFQEWDQFTTFQNTKTQDVLQKIDDIEKKIDALQDEYQESNNSLITFNQVESDSQKMKRFQSQLDQLIQQKLQVHSCLRDNHKCDQVCQICPREKCNNGAGHDQKQEHLCSRKDHRCNDNCDVIDCKSNCMRSFKHDDKHNCQNDHPCKENCKYCDQKCKYDRSTPHDDNHVCKESSCTHNCNLCTTKCKDPHQKSKDQGNHFCGLNHKCQEKCEEKGICEIKYDGEEVIWRTSISEFKYIKYIPKDIGKQMCKLEIPSDKMQHEGLHACKIHTEKQFHNCNQQCPECNTYCDLKYGHKGIHSSNIHRNKENQIFTQKEGNLQQIEIQDSKDSKDTIRKYQIGENSAPETCDQSCKRRGKAHFHLVECKGGNLCLEKNDKFKYKARHSKERYVKFETLNFDEVLCLDFWQLNNWAHPIYSEVNNIRRCNYYCPICFQQKNDYEFCEEEAWHTQDNKISSHGFYCSEEHKKNQIKGINIAFVLDTTGSMSSYIEMCKDTIKKIMVETKAQKNMNGEVLDVNFAVVSYKDHDPPYQQSQNILDIQDFTLENVIIEFLNKLTADGGGDGPEAVLDGLDASLRLNWTYNYVKLLYLIADAPPHGKQYHNFTDSFPEGCPCKLNQKDILQKLWKKKVQFKILQLNQSIDGMISEFKKDFPNLEVVDPKKEDKENQFQNLIIGEVCKYLAHNEITYQMRK